MKVERSIAVYEKEEDSLIEDIQIDLSVDFLADLFQINIDDDPNVYKVYLINKEKFFPLMNSVPELSKFDFDNVEMYLECYQID